MATNYVQGCEPMTETDGFVGAGIGFRRPYRQQLLADDARPQPAALEVVPGHFFAEPELLAPLADRYPLVFHEVACSVGTAKAMDCRVLARIKALLPYGRPLFFSEHLALTTSPDGVDLGHLAPVWYTRDALERISDRVKTWQDTLGLEVALETITAPFVIPAADMTEAEFFHRLVERCGCGLLLDLTNQVINGHNLGFDPVERLSAYPLEAVYQVHLAGSQLGSGAWVDSHDAPVDDASFDLLEQLRGRSPLRTIIIERDQNLPPLAELVGEASRANALWRGLE